MIKTCFDLLQALIKQNAKPLVKKPKKLIYDIYLKDFVTGDNLLVPSPAKDCIEQLGCWKNSTKSPLVDLLMKKFVNPKLDLLCPIEQKLCLTGLQRSAIQGCRYASNFKGFWESGAGNNGNCPALPSTEDVAKENQREDVGWAGQVTNKPDNGPRPEKTSPATTGNPGRSDRKIQKQQVVFSLNSRSKSYSLKNEGPSPERRTEKRKQIYIKPEKASAPQRQSRSKVIMKKINNKSSANQIDNNKPKAENLAKEILKVKRLSSVKLTQLKKTCTQILHPRNPGESDGGGVTSIQADFFSTDRKLSAQSKIPSIELKEDVSTIGKRDQRVPTGFPATEQNTEMNTTEENKNEIENKDKTNNKNDLMMESKNSTQTLKLTESSVLSEGNVLEMSDTNKKIKLPRDQHLFKNEQEKNKLGTKPLPSEKKTKLSEYFNFMFPPTKHKNNTSLTPQNNETITSKASQKTNNNQFLTSLKSGGPKALASPKIENSVCLNDHKTSLTDTCLLSLKADTNKALASPKTEDKVALTSHKTNPKTSLTDATFVSPKAENKNTLASPKSEDIASLTSHKTDPETSLTYASLSHKADNKNTLASPKSEDIASLTSHKTDPETSLTYASLSHKADNKNTLASPKSEDIASLTFHKTDPETSLTYASLSHKADNKKTAASLKTEDNPSLTSHKTDPEASLTIHKADKDKALASPKTENNISLTTKKTGPKISLDSQNTSNNLSLAPNDPKTPTTQKNHQNIYLSSSKPYQETSLNSDKTNTCLACHENDDHTSLTYNKTDPETALDSHRTNNNTSSNKTDNDTSSTFHIAGTNKCLAFLGKNNLKLEDRYTDKRAKKYHKLDPKVSKKLHAISAQGKFLDNLEVEGELSLYNINNYKGFKIAKSHLDTELKKKRLSVATTHAKGSKESDVQSECKQNCHTNITSEKTVIAKETAESKISQNDYKKHVVNTGGFPQSTTMVDDKSKSNNCKNNEELANPTNNKMVQDNSKLTDHKTQDSLKKGKTQMQLNISIDNTVQHVQGKKEEDTTFKLLSADNHSNDQNKAKEPYAGSRCRYRKRRLVKTNSLVKIITKKSRKFKELLEQELKNVDDKKVKQSIEVQQNEQLETQKNVGENTNLLNIASKVVKTSEQGRSKSVSVLKANEMTTKKEEMSKHSVRSKSFVSAVTSSNKSHLDKVLVDLKNGKRIQNLKTKIPQPQIPLMVKQKSVIDEEKIKQIHSVLDRSGSQTQSKIIHKVPKHIDYHYQKSPKTAEKSSEPIPNSKGSNYAQNPTKHIPRKFSARDITKSILKSKLHSIVSNINQNVDSQIKKEKKIKFLKSKKLITTESNNQGHKVNLASKRKKPLIEHKAMELPKVIFDSRSIDVGETDWLNHKGEHKPTIDKQNSRFFPKSDNRNRNIVSLIPNPNVINMQESICLEAHVKINTKNGKTNTAKGIHSVVINKQNIQSNDKDCIKCANGKLSTEDNLICDLNKQEVHLKSRSRTIIAEHQEQDELQKYSRDVTQQFSKNKSNVKVNLENKHENIKDHDLYNSKDVNTKFKVGKGGDSLQSTFQRNRSCTVKLKSLLKRQGNNDVYKVIEPSSTGNTFNMDKRVSNTRSSAKQSSVEKIKKAGLNILNESKDTNLDEIKKQKPIPKHQLNKKAFENIKSNYAILKPLPERNLPKRFISMSENLDTIVNSGSRNSDEKDKILLTKGQSEIDLRKPTGGLKLNKNASQDKLREVSSKLQSTYKYFSKEPTQRQDRAKEITRGNISDQLKNMSQSPDCGGMKLDTKSNNLQVIRKTSCIANSNTSPKLESPPQTQFARTNTTNKEVLKTKSATRMANGSKTKHESEDKINIAAMLNKNLTSNHLPDQIEELTLPKASTIAELGVKGTKITIRQPNTIRKRIEYSPKHEKIVEKKEVTLKEAQNGIKVTDNTLKPNKASLNLQDEINSGAQARIQTKNFDTDGRLKELLNNFLQKKTSSNVRGLRYLNTSNDNAASQVINTTEEQFEHTFSNVYRMQHLLQNKHLVPVNEKLANPLPKSESLDPSTKNESSKPKAKQTAEMSLTHNRKRQAQ